MSQVTVSTLDYTTLLKNSFQPFKAKSHHILNRESKNYSIHYLFSVCSTIIAESFFSVLIVLTSVGEF